MARERGPCGTGISFGLPCALAQCASNAQNALVKRHLSLAPNQCNRKFKNPFLTVLKHFVRSSFRTHMGNNLEDQWRTGKRQVKLAMIDKSKIWDKLKHHSAKSFVKNEVGPKVPTKARLIQGNKTEATAYEHPEEYAAMLHVLKDLADHEFFYDGIKFRFVAACGYSHNDLSDLFSRCISEAGPYVLYDERDGSNWDSTMNKPLLEAEMLVYDMLKMRATEAFIKRHGHVKGKITCRIDTLAKEFMTITYESAWKRLSGDWNTSIGNTIINIIVSFVAITELPSHLRPTGACALVMGDDYAGVYSFSQAVDPKALSAAMNHGEKSMGITPERGIFSNPLDITFISMDLWPRKNGGYQFVPKPARLMNKLFWAAKKLHPNQIPSYRNGICIALWPTFYGFEMMMKFLKAHYTPGVRGLPIEWYSYSYQHDAHTKVVREVDWIQGYTYKYGYPYGATTFDWPRDLGRGGAWLHHPIVEHMLAVESMDPQARPRCLS